eukprot:TRINITY_DN780_c0_g2_i2.p1 TRINITY_DN780_c0_g2~~TRINITY_DN780_c0_g2_i2.p1  ORF type:complete len:203 (+),score=18.97 TRINITY_DN780_c0_g2_i2:446-1054(+)
MMEKAIPEGQAAVVQLSRDPHEEAGNHADHLRAKFFVQFRSAEVASRLVREVDQAVRLFGHRFRLLFECAKKVDVWNKAPKGKTLEEFRYEKQNELAEHKNVVSQILDCGSCGLERCFGFLAEHTVAAACTRVGGELPELPVGRRHVAAAAGQITAAIDLRTDAQTVFPPVCPREPAFRWNPYVPNPREPAARSPAELHPRP